MSSIVEFRGERSGYRCGYCGSPFSKISTGMWAHTMTVQDYQDLIDRGWRRSGKYVYKPVMDKTCCPQYAIKCDVLNFKLNKSHKKVIKKVNKYLNTGVKPGSAGSTSATETDETDGGMNEAACDLPPEKRSESAAAAIPQHIDFAKMPKSFKTASDKEQCQPTARDKVVNAAQVSEGKVVSSSGRDALSTTGDGPDPSKPPCKKAKVLRKERWTQKQAQKQRANPQEQQGPGKKKQNEAKTLEQFLAEVTSNPAHQLELRLVRSSPRSKEFKDTFLESHGVYKKYQMTVHNDPPDKPTEKQFTRFLVDSPLKEEHRAGGAAHGFGSFHQQYWLDGRLVCVGVIDILPSCVSSVYLYYDPEIFFLSPGTYSALREIEFTKKLNQIEPSILSYYMGYYIHSCPKMKYKGQYNPSFLLCPETYTWNPVEQCREKLDANKYSRFAEPGVEDANRVYDLDALPMLYERQAMPFALYRALNSDFADDDEEVRHYARLAGRAAAERMLLYRE